MPHPNFRHTHAPSTEKVDHVLMYRQRLVYLENPVLRNIPDHVPLKNTQITLEKKVKNNVKNKQSYVSYSRFQKVLNK